MSRFRDLEEGHSHEGRFAQIKSALPVATRMCPQLVLLLENWQVTPIVTRDRELPPPMNDLQRPISPPPQEKSPQYGVTVCRLDRGFLQGPDVNSPL